MDVRFLIDEHIDHSIAAALRLRGYDMLTLGDANLLGADDLKAVLPFAVSESRVLITRDADFLAMHADALVALGEVLHTAGDVTQAEGCSAEAARLYEAKGMRVFPRTA